MGTFSMIEASIKAKSQSANERAAMRRDQPFEVSHPLVKVAIILSTVPQSERSIMERDLLNILDYILDVYSKKVARRGPGSLADCVVEDVWANVPIKLCTKKQAHELVNGLGDNLVLLSLGYLGRDMFTHRPSADFPLLPSDEYMSAHPNGHLNDAYMLGMMPLFAPDSHWNNEDIPASGSLDDVPDEEMAWETEEAPAEQDVTMA
ncbi:unnamed protein product [Peniophora sp. CBMAI 1063]|nr:unnamed protein product [Peniophora sp. CBMAI 1063]